METPYSYNSSVPVIGAHAVLVFGWGLDDKGWFWNISADKSKEYILLFEEFLSKNGHLIIPESETKYINAANKQITTKSPRKPNSSPSTLKMKSL